MGPLLGGFLRRVVDEVVFPSATGIASSTVLINLDPGYHVQYEWVAEVPPVKDDRPSTADSTITSPPEEMTSTGTALSTTFPPLLPIAQQTAQRAGKPVGFLGLFFRYQYDTSPLNCMILIPIS